MIRKGFTEFTSEKVLISSSTKCLDSGHKCKENKSPLVVGTKVWSHFFLFGNLLWGNLKLLLSYLGLDLSIKLRSFSSCSWWRLRTTQSSTSVPGKLTYVWCILSLTPTTFIPTGWVWVYFLKVPLKHWMKCTMATQYYYIIK